MKRLILFVFSCLFISLDLCASVRLCNPPSASATLDINNVRTKLLNGGDMFWDIFNTNSAAYEIPKGSGIHSSFTSSLLISAMDAGNNLYTAGQTYRQTGLDFWPGALNNQGEIDSIDCNDWDDMFNVYGYEINKAKSKKGVDYNIARWPSSIAPFYDTNADGIYDPSLGDYPIYYADKPDIIPGQMIFWVFNDKGNVHTAYQNSLSMSLEIQATAIAFESKTSEVINNSTIFRFRLINKSSNTYSHFRFGCFNDGDLGNPNDDYIGCDLSTNSDGNKRNLFFFYNGDSNDENGAAKGYGLAPPAFGLTILNPGPGGDVHSFIAITGTSQPGTTSDPRNPTELNRYLSGLWANGLPITYGTPFGRDGTDPCFFMFPGLTDPNGRPNWVETITPTDRRTILALKEQTFLPGENKVIELAYVWARDTPETNLGSVAKLALSTDTLINAYKNDFSSFSTGIKKVYKIELRVFPNPAFNEIRIEGVSIFNGIKIYNTQGVLVKEVLKPTKSNIDISNLPNGVYLIQVGQYSAKFIKH